MQRGPWRFCTWVCILFRICRAFWFACNSCLRFLADSTLKVLVSGVWVISELHQLRGTPWSNGSGLRGGKKEAGRTAPRLGANRCQRSRSRRCHIISRTRGWRTARKRTRGLARTLALAGEAWPGEFDRELGRAEDGSRLCLPGRQVPERAKPERALRGMANTCAPAFEDLGFGRATYHETRLVTDPAFLVAVQFFMVADSGKPESHTKPHTLIP